MFSMFRRLFSESIYNKTTANAGNILYHIQMAIN